MFLSRMMMTPPVAEESWTHVLDIETGSPGFVGIGPGFYSISPTTFEGATFEYFRTGGAPFASTTVAVVMRFGGTTFGTNHIQVEMEGVAGVYTFTDISDFRYAALNSVPANETLYDAIIAASGTTREFNLSLVAG